MSVSDEISRLETAKSNLRTAIGNKGVTVDSTATLDTYATAVNSIVVATSDINVYNLTALTTAAAPQTFTAAQTYDAIKYNNTYYLYGGYYSRTVWFIKCMQTANTSGTTFAGDGMITQLQRISFVYNSSGAIASVTSSSGTGTNLEDTRTAVGTWLWTPRLDWGGTITGDNVYSINFTSNSTSYTKLEPDVVGYEMFYGSTRVAYGTTPTSPGGAQTVWTNTNYRTIKITGGTDVTNSTLLTVLRNNAFKYIG